MHYTPLHLLRHRRSELMLSQAQAAALCGVSVQTWSSWEEGRRRPSYKARSTICTKFGIAMHDPGWAQGEVVP